MAKTMREKVQSFSKERQENIARLAAEMVEEELTLRELRKKQRLTQEQIAQFLGVNQESISRLERRNNIYVSTLRNYIHAIGGKLHLDVELQNGETIRLVDEGEFSSTDEASVE